jgi:hypothetical protein
MAQACRGRGIISITDLNLCYSIPGPISTGLFDELPSADSKARTKIYALRVLRIDLMSLRYIFKTQ